MQERRAREAHPEPVPADQSNSKARRVRAWLAAKAAAARVAKIAKDITEAAG